MMRKWIPLAVACAAIALAGCASKRAVKPVAEAGAPRTEVGTEGSGATTAGAEAAGGAVVASTGEEAAGPAGEQLAKRLVYFDFDSYELRPQDTALVVAHGHYLASHPKARVRLEGHTDERGSREYNIGLGERRAQAVKRALLLQGVAESQLATVSYGEERPAVAGSDEGAWAQNRRVEIVYTQ